ncbi:hypothetical protein [Bacillus cereus group sp. BfR-BA-01309]|uniref:hypothetical protein n=1 Tax=Bacillus cereus group sp. BfR-BA-01309 TaxID=2920286 RepID=UPI001F5AE909|nr:hypothetical protein [Bacillus cereus group sp. BfR-BA-01309]
MKRFDKCKCHFPCVFPPLVVGPTGPTGPTGATGPTGSTGATGPTGTVSAILQPFANSSINTQTIASGGLVVLPTAPGPNIQVVGITYNNVDTFTIVTPGLYYLSAQLNFNVGTAPNSNFAIAINGVPIAPASNANGAGMITISQVANYAAGTTISIFNNSPTSVTIENGVNTTGAIQTFSAGSFALFRFADGPI